MIPKIPVTSYTLFFYWTYTHRFNFIFCCSQHSVHFDFIANTLYMWCWMISVPNTMQCPMISAYCVWWPLPVVCYAWYSLCAVHIFRLSSCMTKWDSCAPRDTLFSLWANYQAINTSQIGNKVVNKFVIKTFVNLIMIYYIFKHSHYIWHWINQWFNARYWDSYW